MIWRDGALLGDTPPIDPQAASWGVFTTVGCDGGRPLLWPQHEARLVASLEQLDATSLPSLPDQRILEDLLSGGGLSGPAKVRVVVHREPRSGQWSVEATAQAIAAAGPQERPLRLEVVRWSAPPPLIGLKSLARLPWDLARSTANRCGADDALLVTDSGLVLETSVANIWARFGRTVVTPQAPASCLPGIMRAWIVQILPLLSLKAVVRDLAFEELISADEVWVSNAVTGARSVARIGATVWTDSETVKSLAAHSLPAPGWPSCRRSVQPDLDPEMKGYNGIRCTAALE